MPISRRAPQPGAELAELMDHSLVPTERASLRGLVHASCTLVSVSGEEAPDESEHLEPVK